MTYADPLILALTGQAGTGKDTAAEHLVDRYGFIQVAFADVINDMAAVLLEAFDVDHAVLHERALKERPIPQIPGTPSARHIKQALGDCFRAIHPELFVAALATRIGVQDLPRSVPIHDRIVISDVRYQNEAALVAGLGGRLIRLYRDQAAPVRAHSSEAMVAALPVSLELWNNGSSLGGLHALIDGACATWGIEPRSFDE